MTAAIDTEFDWRTQGVCKINDPHFTDIETVMEDYGLPEGEAKKVVAVAEQQAKAICLQCPIRGKCRDVAIQNDEMFGIWGGMTVAERIAYTPTWLKIKKSLGANTQASVVKDQDQLHHNPGHNKTFVDRLRRAKACREALVQQPDFRLHSQKMGHHGYDEYMHILELIIGNPDKTAAQLAERLGRKATWFNKMFRDVCDALGV